MADLLPLPPKEECIRVVVRCRPLNSKETADGRKTIVDMNLKTGQIVLNNPKGENNEPPKSFTFDSVFDKSVSQMDVYNGTARVIVDNVLSGYNGTVFAYGQTGTGKTHSMEGKEEPPEMRGITPNSFEHIFNHIQASSGMQYLVRASFLEIYNEEIRDLLGKDPKAKLELKENKDGVVYVKGLNAFVVKSANELRNVLNVGKQNRSVGATLMNADSSRSHCIFSVTVEMIEQGVNSDGHIRVGKLNLVDLAGSERQSKTGATGDRLKEATKINLSLSALGNVISALVDGKPGSHIPYRDSKLTRLLQDSLGGNTKTVMVANVGPADWNYDETLSTLRYANRAKNIKNKPKINEDPKDAMLREFQDEIMRLKAALSAAESGKPFDPTLFGAKTVVEEDDGPAEEEEHIVEKVVQVKRQVEQHEIDKMRADMEKKMQTELKAQGVKIDAAQLAAVRAEAERKAKEEARRIEEERKKAEEEAKKAQESIAKAKAEMQNKAKDAEQIKHEKEELAKKLKAMEAKILKGEEHGGLLEVTKKKEEELRKREVELERKRKDEEQNQHKIAELEEAQLAAEGKYSSKQEEVNQKTVKLKKLYRKYQEVNAEVEDLYKEFQREKEDLLDSIRLLNHQMRLKDMVIEGFIPGDEMQKVMKRAQWDEEREVWVLERLSDIGKRDGGLIRRPISAASARRPTSDFAKLAAAMGDLNPRFKSDNILSLELDMPERTTFDYAGPNMDPRVQAAIDTAFADGERLLITS